MLLWLMDVSLYLCYYDCFSLDNILFSIICQFTWVMQCRRQTMKSLWWNIKNPTLYTSIFRRLSFDLYYKGLPAIVRLNSLRGWNQNIPGENMSIPWLWRPGSMRRQVTSNYAIDYVVSQKQWVQYLCYLGVNKYMYCHTPNIRRTESQNLNVTRLVL